MNQICCKSSHHPTRDPRPGHNGGFISPRMPSLSPALGLSRQTPVIQSGEGRDLRDRRVRDILIFRVLREKEGTGGLGGKEKAPSLGTPSITFGRSRLHLFAVWVATHRPDNAPRAPVSRLSPRSPLTANFATNVTVPKKP